MESQMADFDQNNACGTDGCGTATEIRSADAPLESPPTVQIEVVSDAICPWCYIAKRHLDGAVAELRKDFDVDVRWLPFELNADMPKAGQDRKKYRSAKFGTWERSQSLDAHVAKAGRNVGLDFHHERMERTPNTFDAHRLIWLAEKEGVQDAVVEGLFAGYFTNGRDVGGRAVLAQIAAEAGLNHDQVEAFLESDGGSEPVRILAAAAYASGLSGVPTIFVNGHALFSGARSTEVMVAAIRKAVGPKTSSRVSADGSLRAAR
jgi:predicted DsbA family dithiol-disulfide isomerase